MRSKMKLIAIVALFTISLLTVSSCGGRRTKVTSISAKDATVDANWSPEDIKKVRNYMIDSIAESRFIRGKAFRRQKPAWMLAKEMANDTDEHINTRVIMEKIRTKLINEVGATFIDDQALSEILEQQALQQSDLFNNAKAAKIGKLVGAKLILRGRISNIRKKSARTDINYYTVTLQLVGLETSKILWTDEYEIGRKAQKSRFR